MKALFYIREGYYELVRSGPHLAKLAEFGFIERGRDSRYVITETGQAALAASQRKEPT